MEKVDPIELLFGGMKKLGPGSNADTLKVLNMLPQTNFKNIIDAGCGTGRQTLTLAKHLQTLIHAVDTYQPFLTDIKNYAKDAGVEELVKTYCLDMKNIPEKFKNIDLLWSEGAAYQIGFINALKTWYPVINDKGFVVVSELAWLDDEIPTEIKDYFQNLYPEMKNNEENQVLIKDIGYKLLDTYILPRKAWVEGYYDILKPRAKNILDHPDDSVRNFAAETIEEIRVFNKSDNCYGYVFYIMQKV